MKTTHKHMNRETRLWIVLALSIMALAISGNMVFASYRDALATEAELLAARDAAALPPNEWAECGLASAL